MGDKNYLFLPYFFNSLFMSNVGPWNDNNLSVLSQKEIL